MGRPKGTKGKKRYFSQETKLKAVNKVLLEKRSQESVRKEYDVNSGVLHSWIKKYLNEGQEGLKTKDNPRCPYPGLHLKKELTDIEKLQLENMKLRIENERLKKGYIVEGDGQSVVYDTSRYKNLK